MSGRGAVYGWTSGWALLVALTLFPLALGGVPLLDGLTYELAVVTAFLFLFIAVALGSAHGRTLALPYATRFRRLEETPAERLRPRLRRDGLRLLLGAGLATLVPIAHGMRAGCAWERGLPVYAYVVLPTIPIGLALGVLAGVLGGHRRGRRVGVVLLVLAVLSTVPLVQLLFGPRAVFHDLVLGQITATGYLGFDPVIRMGSVDLLHRAAALVLAQVLLAAALLVATRRMLPASEDPRVSFAELRGEEVRRRWRRLGLVAAVFCGFLALGERAGFGTGRRTLEQALASVHESTHFTLRVRPGSRAEPLALALLDDCEWAYFRLSSALGIVESASASAPARITVYVYEDEVERERLTGAHGYLFAKPWTGELSTDLSERGELEALPHELAHVLAARFGLPLLGISYRYGLIEGLAEGAAGEYAVRPWRHERVAAALEAGLLPHAEDLVGTTGFALRDARASYEAAASLSGFLLRRYGADRLRAVYAWGDFASAYGRPLGSLDQEWRAYLESIPVGARARAYARRAFDRTETPAFFETACARLGTRNQETGPATIARVAHDDAGALARTTSDLDREAATGSPLDRDAALERLATVLVRSDRVAEAAVVTGRRVDLGVAPALLRSALRMGAETPAFAAALAAPPAPGAVEAAPAAVEAAPGAASLQASLEVVSLLRASATQGFGEEDVTRARALGIGGCSEATAPLEGRVLVRAAVGARRAGDRDAARVLAENARSLVDALDDDRREAELELERLAWEKASPHLAPLKLTRGFALR